MSRRSRFVACWAFAVLGVAVGTARADDGGGLEDLLNETIITTASQSAERGSTAPATSTILTAEDIRTYGIHSIAEAIDFLSLGAVTSDPLRAVDIGARGVLLPNDQGDHFLLLIDGHAANEALYGAARYERGAGIPMEIVDHIEVILGPGSVLYGSNAMLGVINVVTRRAQNFAGVHAVAESEIGKSWRAAAGVGYEMKLGGAPAAITVELEYYRQSGPAFTVGPQNFGTDWASGQPWVYARGGQPTGIWGGVASHSYYSEVPAAILTFKLKNLEITLHASSYKRASPFNHRFAETDSDFDDPRNYELDRSAFIDIKHHVALSPVVGVSERLYGDTFDYQRYIDVSAPSQCLFVDVTTCRRATLSASRWVGLELQGSFDWLQDHRLVTLIGVDGRIRKVGSITDTLDYDTGAHLDSSNGVLSDQDAILGSYLQQTYAPTRWLGINAGLRLDHDRRFGERGSPRVAASIGVWQGGTLKGVYSEAFRAPSWQESAWTAERQILAENLKPESVRSVEASFDQSLGSHRLMFGVFRSWWSDLVELHVLSFDERVEAERRGLLDIAALEATQYRNVSSIDNYGFNAGYEGSFAERRLRYGTNVTGAIARRTEVGGVQEPLTVAPQLFGNARVSYDFGTGFPTLGIATHYLAKRPADRAFGAGFTPAPFAPAQLELRATLVGAVPGIKGLSYRGTLNYAMSSRSAYVVGPIQSTTAGIVQGVPLNPPAELAPVDTLRATVGLEYEFGGSP